MGVDTA